MKKITTMVVILVILLTIYLFFFILRDDGNMKGIVVRDPQVFSQWGIEDGLLFKKRLLVNNLPLEFKQEGLRLRCKYKIIDVVGGPFWVAVVEVESCNRI